MNTVARKYEIRYVGETWKCRILNNALNFINKVGSQIGLHYHSKHVADMMAIENLFLNIPFIDRIDCRVGNARKSY